MNRISKGQLAALLLITDTFTLFCLMGSVSLMTAAGFVSGTALQFLMSLPLIKLCADGGSYRKWAEMFYLVYLILWGGLLFTMQWNASEVIYIPYENSGGIWGKLLISGLIALVCLYISSTGIKALSRAAVIAAAVGAVCLIVVTVSAVFGSDWENLTHVEVSFSFREEFVRGFSISGGLGSLVILLKLTDSKPFTGAIVYFLGKAVLTAAAVIAAVLVAGGIMEITDFPIVTAAQLSQPFSAQRIDSLFLIVFAVFAVFAIAVQTVLAAYLIGEIFPNFRRYRSCCALALMIGAAFALSGAGRYNMIYAAAVMLTLFVVPTIMLLENKMSKGRVRS